MHIEASPVTRAGSVFIDFI